MIYLHVIFLISDVIITPVLIFQQGVNMRKILVVVDMQNDFVDGVLGSKEASEIVDPMCKYLMSFDGEVVFTEDTHFDNYSSTQEGRFLPVPHCIKGTKGHELHPKLQKIAELKQSKIFEKTSFGSLELSAYLKSLWDAGELESIFFTGVCTDICVISNALLVKAQIPECPIKLIKDLCAGVSKQKNQSALDVMQSCQIELV